MKVKRFPSFFTWRFRLWYNLMFGVASRKARSLLTVSEFSKREIVATLRVSAQRITVIPNGWQHLQKIVPDPTVLDTYHGLCGPMVWSQNRYCIAVSPTSGEVFLLRCMAYVLLESSKNFLLDYSIAFTSKIIGYSGVSCWFFLVYYRTGA